MHAHHSGIFLAAVRLSGQVMYLQVFEIKPLRAWGAVATTVVSVALSIYLISVSPTYLLPLAWAFAGTAWTGVSQSSHALCKLIGMQ